MMFLYKPSELCMYLDGVYNAVYWPLIGHHSSSVATLGPTRTMTLPVASVGNRVSSSMHPL